MGHPGSIWNGKGSLILLVILPSCCVWNQIAILEVIIDDNLNGRLFLNLFLKIGQGHACYHEGLFESFSSRMLSSHLAKERSRLLFAAFLLLLS